MNNSLSKALRAVFAGTLMFMTWTNAMAQGDTQPTPTVHGNVYGGGNLADVKTNTVVNMSTGTVEGSVFGGGKGKADNFTCDKAMVGVNEDGVTVSGEGENAVYTLKEEGGTTVNITNGTVKGDVYGGGEVGRVERNTIVTIGTAGDDSSTPIIEGHVFGAGKGVETHGYSALVRGNATVTIQGKAQVWQNVHGGGEKASVGRYYVAQNQTDADTYHVRIGMPCYLKAGGKCTVNIQDGVTIGKEANTGDVYGAGQGVRPSWAYAVYSTYNDRINNNSKRMANHVDYDSGTNTGHNPSSDYKGKTWDYYVDEDGNEDTRYVWEYFTNNDDYLLYVETLARASETDVVIGGKRETTGESPSITASTNAPTVKGTVYGGSESGFVYYSTAVNMLKGTVNGDVFGGGKGLLSFAEAGRVRINTNLTISDGTIGGNVYGGGSLGDVGRINKSDQTDYNYMWTDQTDPVPNPKNPDSYTWNNTGVCNVTINGGMIGVGVAQNSDGTYTKGNVFGAGKGSGETWWCEKAIAYKTNVIITAGTVNGTVYGGGQVGRVETDATVTIGEAPAGGGSGSGESGEGSGGATHAPTIAGNVFGAGAGLATHGYSALVRGNSTVTVQGTAQVGGSVYGGGEIASVGRFTVVGGLPKAPQRGGDCVVNIKDQATIGTSGTSHNVFGACKGVTPAYDESNPKNNKSMQTLANGSRGGTQGVDWDPYPGDSRFVWKYYTTPAAYLAFLKTLALTSHPHVTIGGTWTKTGSTESITSSGNPSVYGSVYGGGQRGITLGSVDVNIVGGTVVQDVYGGGALADTNVGNWDEDDYTEVTGLSAESSVTGLYERSGAGTSESPYNYTLTADQTFNSSKTYYSKGKWHDTTQMTALYTTTVDLTGGTIKGDAYGGGLGQKTGFYDAQNTIATKDIEAVVWGDINVTLGSDGGSSATSFYTTYENDNTGKQVIKSGRVFGCNNLLGSPQGDVTVTVWRTVAGNGGTQVRTTADVKTDNKDIMDAHPDDYETVSGYVTPTYEVAAVYGGGNLAPYEAAGKKAHVIINGCDATSIQTVYGGGNAAAVPETDVDINSCYEIGSVFGGGNGKDKYKKGNDWTINPGANVNGNASTLIYGGTVHEAYGGSNEKGTIHGSVVIDVADSGLKEGDDGYCALDVAKLVGAGKNADVNGDLKLIMGCKPETKIPLVYGGADNANVNGDVELTITSGNFGKVIGGNNNGGVIKGHIILNIEETTCIPINIDHLYLCGYNAPYSQYGYYVKTTTTEGTPIGNPSETAVLTTDGKLQFIPRESADDLHLPVNTYSYSESGVPSWTVLPITGDNKFEGYAPPVLNVISCTSIGEVFGGGYGTTATVYGNPTVNINMIPGAYASSINRAGTTSGHALGEIGVVYGGGDAAKVCGNTTVNIGTKTTVPVYKFAEVNGEYKVQYEQDEVTPQTETKNVEGAYITGNVYGGGKLADVTGNTYVNVCAEQVAALDANNQPTGEYTYNVVNITGTNYEGVTIGGNVYGGGEGSTNTFTCEKAMIGIDKDGINNPEGGTTVNIFNGLVRGNVYGGGEIGRVEKDTKVTIGTGGGVAPDGTATSAPVIKGNVFGGGKGKETHGYAALVRGNPTVLVEGNAKVEGSVYGGGEIASVARYDLSSGVPVALAQTNGHNSGYCTVTVQGYAEIGPNGMKMYHPERTDGTDKPDDWGHVFAAGKGILPTVYDYTKPSGNNYHTQQYEITDHMPRRMAFYKDKKSAYWEYADPDYVEPANATADDLATQNVWEYYSSEEEYFAFIETQALATQTSLTIGGHAFVKGSAYGGSENGTVQYDTNVTIQDNCQIGQGQEITTRYEDYTDGNLFNLTTPPIKTGSGSTAVYYDLECAHWDYDITSGAPYDPYAKYKKEADGKYYYDSGYTKYAEGGAVIAKDGHTYYGNVFGGGSGSVPYFDTHKGISKYIMTAGQVKGNTNVTINGGHILTNVYGGCEATNVLGDATVKMTNGTLGVPRTLAQIDAHPVTCYLFGAGKGDQRVFFNKDTNVRDVEVEITGGKIFGSVFGGGEDGHVLRDVTMTIGKVTTTGEGDEAATTISGPTIGNWGTSYVDGNVFGGGRGFGGDAYTAGNIAGSVEMEIKGGNILGSIYGGGRLGSVGYGLFDAETDDGDPTPGYGEMRKDTDTETGFSTSNFFTNGRGHIDITISGGTIGNTHEYIIPNATNMAAAGIPEADRDISKWNDENKYWNTWRTYHNIPKTEFDTTTGHLMHTKGGNVFAGGMGRFYQLDGSTAISAVDWWKLGNVKSTKLTITGGNILSNVYGGGELGMVQGGSHTSEDNKTVSTEIIISGGTIGTDIADYTFGSVFGGGYGSLIEKFTHTGGKPDSYPKYIAGRVKGSTEVTISGSSTVVKASVYGGGEMAAVGESEVLLASTDPVVPGETLTGENGAPVEANTYVIISGGTIGKAKEGTTYFGGAKMGNVYGGGSGHNNTVRSGHIYGNTNVTISDGVIYHNVYGGGAYGSVGDFTYHLDNTTKKVDGISGRHADRTDTGTANVTITGGTIGYDGKENGMIFGSSRGDINQPEERDDYTAWVYNANVIIGTAATGTPGQEGYVAATGPSIKGTVYGSGENGHVFNDAEVTINYGTIGIYDNTDPGYTVTSNGTEYAGAAYPYRGNVYGGGCGTDKYYSGTIPSGHTYNDGEGDTYNSLAGIVYGNATVNITGGTVVRNVYGAGAMGSVGKTVTTTANNVTTTSISGGTTTINVSGGTIGVDGTNGDGNVFGAARGDKDAIINQAALVRKNTNVSITGGTIEGNVYGGGELGCVGTFTVSPDMRTFTWQDTDGATNEGTSNNKNTGVCNVTVNGSSAVINGHVFGAGKGKESTFWCEKGIAYSTNVNISNGTVHGNVYGGGEVGRVETDSKVKIGLAPEEEGGNSEPIINGSVFGGGAGVETHGYSALVRGNTTVIVDEDAHVAHSVYGGGEIASVGRYGLDEQKMPSILQGGGYCYVTVLGNAQIGDDVYGAGQGVTPHFDMTNTDPSKRSRRMTVYTNATDFPAGKEYPNEGYTWGRYETGSQFVWDYLQSESAYSTYLETLALATHPEVTIDGNATVSGSVFGGGELGLTKGSVIVNIQGGTIAEDVYGGGSLAHSNTTSTVDLDGDGTTENIDPTTTVNLKSGTINRNVYGGGLGQLAKNAENGINYTAEEAAAYNAAHNLNEGDEGYKTTSDWRVEPVEATTPVEAKVYGEVLVKLNEPTTTTTGEGEGATTTTTYGDCEVKGTIFGCNNLNGSPQKNVTVHVYKTVTKSEGVEQAKPTKNTNTYEVEGVYGGGNLAAYYPDDATARETAKTNVIIDGCDLTSIRSVYGGGNAASVPETEVVVNGTWEIGEVFAGGNGNTDVSYDGGETYKTNPGANVGYRNYSGWDEDGNIVNASDADTKEHREANYAYGQGKAHVTIYGGTVHKVYGGSNKRGNVRVEARTTLIEGDDCEFNVGEAYGGGNDAPMDGDAILEAGCIPGLDIAYGGAANADVNGDVILNITNGTYGRVFGGNDQGGVIRGTITVNIEETGCRPIVIGQLYGGGNLAAYSVDNIIRSRTDIDFNDPTADNYYKNYPKVNVKSFTSIGTVFGGGYGNPATLEGNPQVNINVYEGKYYKTFKGNDNVINDNAKVVGVHVKYPSDNDSQYGTGYPVPSHAKGAIGAINDVFGGGNEAKVIGNPTVNIGTEAGEEVYVAVEVKEGEELKGYCTRTGEGTTENPYQYSELTEGTAPNTATYYLKTVKAVDIRGNVFGGGNNAEVEGDTNVVIGKKITTP